MDKSARHHYIVILISLLLCLFVYVDSYLIPIKTSLKKVQNLAEYRSGKRGQNMDYTVTIDNKEYDIPQGIYNTLNTDENALLYKSAFTGSLQKIGVIKEQEIWIYNAGYVRARFGKLAVPAIILGCLLMFIFFKIIDSIQGRANLAYALFICSLLLLFAHLDLDIF
jgi:hypothetical protein